MKEATENQQRPGRGDMFKTVDSYPGSYFTGRVMEDEGEMLTVIRSSDEGLNGKPLNYATSFSIAAEFVQKIKDWIKT